MPELARLSAFGTSEGATPARARCRRDVVVSESPPLAKLRVQRLSGTSTAQGSSLAHWELAANTTTGSDPLVFWTSPVERLVVSASRSIGELCAALAAEPQAAATVATDVSHALAVLRVEGSGALAALATDVALDLEGPEMGPGRCAQTLFAQLPVLLHRPGSALAYDLYVDRATARYGWDWLVRCAGGEEREI